MFGGVNVGRLDALFDQLILYGLLKKSYLHWAFFLKRVFCVILIVTNIACTRWQHWLKALCRLIGVWSWSLHASMLKV